MTYGQLEDDFKLGYYEDETVAYLYGTPDGRLMAGEPKCCCLPVKCRMPDTIAITLSGFWSEWIIQSDIQRFHSHAGCASADCPPNVFPEDCYAQLRECFRQGDALKSLTWFPTRDRFVDGPGEAYLCIQNPELLAYFPSISCGQGIGCDPPAPITVDALYTPWIFVGGPDLFVAGDGKNLGFQVPDVEGWTVSLPSCAYWFGGTMSIYFVSVTAGDLDGQTVIMRRRTEQMPPVLRPHITRQQTPAPGERFTDAQLLFDVYLRAFQPDWVPRDENGDPTPEWDGRVLRYSVDYLCNPRFFPPGVDGRTNIFIYECLAPGGIVPPKLRVDAHQGGGGAELDFTVEPVIGVGLSPRDTLWQVAGVTIASGGSNASVGDLFRIDFYETPMRGGEYRDSSTPQEVVVTSVDGSGAVTGVALVEQTYTNPDDGTSVERRVYYGRFLCHPNGVALRGTGYSEGDQIEWRIVDQPPTLGGGFAREYQRARAVVTEVDENGGILDWHMPNAQNGDGDNRYTAAYDCVPPAGGCVASRSAPHEPGAPCNESRSSPVCDSSLVAVDCRGLYSDVMDIERCYLIYEGYAGFRASAAVGSNSFSVCSSLFCGGSAYSPKCSIQTIPIYFEIFPVETRLRIDISPPTSVQKVVSVASLVINITPAPGNTFPATLPLPSPLPQVPFEDDFLQVSQSSVSAQQGQTLPLEINSVSQYAGRAGDQWVSSATVSVTHGEISRAPAGQLPRGKSLTITGTLESVGEELTAIFYWPPASQHGQDRLNVSLEITPPGYDRPIVAVARATELLDRCDDIPGCDPDAGLLPDYGVCFTTCGDEALLDYYLMTEWGLIKGFDYPESRPLGGLKTYELIEKGAGYAVWNHDSKQWEPQPEIDVHIGSAWDDFRVALINSSTSAFDAFASASAVVDVDTGSATFGKIIEVNAEKEGYWYVLHEYDKMWRAKLSWNFRFGWLGPGGAGPFNFPDLIHKDGYTFGETYPCGNPEETDYSWLGTDLMSQCQDRTKRCKPYPNDALWSFEYCPHDLLKSYEMMMRADPVQYPNRPTLLGLDAYGTCRSEPPCDYTAPTECCKWGVGWCEHPGSAVTHDVVCFLIYEDGSVTVGDLPSSYSLFLNFGNGPITFTIEAIDDAAYRGDDRERSVY